MKAQDFVRATAAYHDELCPVAWTNTSMRPEVRARLIEIAELFVQYLEVPGFEVYDVVLTGSLANYNWTQFSDFDLHVVTDYADLNADDLAEKFYRAKKTIWNDRHDITIYGHEVELYVEDINEPPVSGGVFSVYNGEWIKTPDHKNPNVNDTAVVRKVQELSDQVERCITTADDPMDLRRLTDKLRKMRQAGLDAGGEFSVENLAYKTIRNMGLIKALHDAYIEKQDDSMRLNEFAPGGGFEPPKRPPVPGNRRDDDDERPEIMPLEDVAKAIMMHIGDAFTCERMRDHRGKFNPAQPGFKFVPKDKTKFGMAKIWCQGDRRGEFPVYHTSLYNYFMGSDGKVLATGQMVEKMKQKTNQNAMHTAELIYNHTAGALQQSNN